MLSLDGKTERKRAAVEDHDAELLLDLAYRFAQRGLGNVVFLRRAGKAALRIDRENVGDISGFDRIHTRPPPPGAQGLF